MAKKVDNRNLTVCETFDNFANKVDYIDFSVEDIVALVTSLSNVFYWLNVESVWGPIGFTWSQVDSHGVFNKTTIPFTIIPKLPDGHRIKQFDNTFNNVSTDTLEIKKSDWSNLTRIHNLFPASKHIRADFTGNALNMTSNNDYFVYINSNDDKGSLYLKGDFSGIIGGSIIRGHMDNPIYTTYRVLFDDDNKGLHIRSDVALKGILKYTGEGVFDISYYVDNVGFKTDGSKTCTSMLSKSYKYRLPNAFIRTDKNYIAYRLSYWGSNPNFDKEVTADIIDPVSNGFIPMEVTIDMNNSDGICHNDRFLEKYPGRMILKPMQFEGEVKGLSYYNPNVVIQNDNWAVYRQDLVDVLTNPATSSNNEKGHFMPNSHLYINHKCPYTIDCRNLEELRLFTNARLYCDDITAFDGYRIDAHGQKIIDLFPQLINIENVKTLSFYGCENNPAYVALPNGIDVDVLYTFNNIIPYGTKITVGSIYPLVWGSKKIGLENRSVPSIRVRRPSNGKPIEINLDQYEAIDGPTPDTDINWIEFDEDILNDTEYLKTCRITNTFGLGWFSTKSKYIFHNPLIFIKGFYNEGQQSIEVVRGTIDEGVFVFLYRVSITATNINDDTTRTMKNIRTYIKGIQPNDMTGVEMRITLKKLFYDQLTDEEKNHIINDLGYILVNQI